MKAKPLSNITKNQHYVPQFLLRNFATERKRVHRTNVLDLVRNSFRKNQSVADICSQNYFYDKNNAIEEFLNRNVETPAANEIQSLCSEDAVVKALPSRELARFISVQITRTAEASNQMQVFVNGMFKTIFRESSRLNSFDEDAAEHVRLVPKEPRSVSSHLALNGYIAWLLIHDLEQHLVINRTSHEFVISDHPVVHSNLYLYGLNVLNTGSLSVAGAQLFLPISPNKLLCLYDPRIYKYGQKASRISQLDSVETAKAINILQLRNRPSVIMFRRYEDYDTLQCLSSRWHQRPLWEYKSFYNPAESTGGNKMKSLHAVSKIQSSPEVRLPFFNIKKKIGRRAVLAKDRIPEAVEAVERVMKESMKPV
jgi:hypothetical protein